MPWMDLVQTASFVTAQVRFPPVGPNSWNSYPVVDLKGSSFEVSRAEVQET